MSKKSPPSKGPKKKPAVKKPIRKLGGIKVRGGKRYAPKKK